MERSQLATADEAVRALRAGGYDALVLEVGDPAHLQTLVRSVSRLAAPPPLIVAGRERRRDAELVAVETVGQAKRLIPRSSILYGRALGDYVRIVCADGRYLIKGRISEMESRWERFGFVRTHRCYVVNASHVRELRPGANGTATLQLSDEQRIPVSRRQAARVRAALNV